MSNIFQFKPKEQKTTRTVKVNQCGCGSEEFYISVEWRIVCCNCRKQIKGYMVAEIPESKDDEEN